jgi:hypothetical protein
MVTRVRRFLANPRNGNFDGSNYRVLQIRALREDGDLEFVIDFGMSAHLPCGGFRRHLPWSVYQKSPSNEG